MTFPATPSLATDCVIIDQEERVLLVCRKNPPFQGILALPGGFVDLGETVEEACRREVQEETSVELADLLLVGVYSAPNRDPRGHVVSVVYVAEVEAVEAKAGDDASEVQWVTDIQILELAFDHREVIEDALWMLERDDVTQLN